MINNLSFGILQAARTRISKTEYISCPSCGRTLFDLQETTQMIREIATVVAPNLIATPAISTAIKGNKAVQASKFLNDPCKKHTLWLYMKLE